MCSRIITSLTCRHMGVCVPSVCNKAAVSQPKLRCNTKAGIYLSATPVFLPSVCRYCSSGMHANFLGLHRTASALIHWHACILTPMPASHSYYPTRQQSVLLHFTLQDTLRSSCQACLHITACASPATNCSASVLEEPAAVQPTELPQGTTLAAHSSQTHCGTCACQHVVQSLCQAMLVTMPSSFPSHSHHFLAHSLLGCPPAPASKQTFPTPTAAKTTNSASIPLPSHSINSLRLQASGHHIVLRQRSNPTQHHQGQGTAALPAA